jgi:hypothetical protein
VEDRHRAIRELPFDIVADALGIDISKFRQRKGGTEWAGNCFVHQPKRNSTAFSYSVDGKWNRFSCGARQGRHRPACGLVLATLRQGIEAAVERRVVSG